MNKFTGAHGTSPSTHKRSWRPIVIAVACLTCFLFFLSSTTLHNEEAELSNGRSDSTPLHRDAVLSLSRANREKVAPIVKVKYASGEKPIPPVVLPSFAVDNREYVFSSLIERSLSNPIDLHVTTFLLSHPFLTMPEIKLRKVRKDAKDSWYRAAKHAVKTQYLPSGRRTYPVGEGFTCRIQNAAKSKVYIVAGEFVPNRLSSTVSSNRKLDVLRCPMVVLGTAELLQLIAADETVHVELYQGTTPLISFDIPWKKRAVGYLTNVAEVGTRADPWEGLLQKGTAPRSNGTDPAASAASPMRTHLCAPCMKKAVSRSNIPLVLEFVAQHLNIGFDHITLSSVWHPSSSHYHDLVNLLEPFIREGAVTVTSLADPRDLSSPLFELDGMMFYRYVMATIQANWCLYMSKGVDDYLLVQDLDEFLVPRVNMGKDSLPFLIGQHVAHGTDHQLFATHKEMMMKPWAGGPGWADGNRHPLCFLSLQTEVVMKNPALVGSESAGRTWLGNEFRHNSEANSSRPHVQLLSAVMNSIVPTQLVYMVGMRAPGSCALPWYWNGCKNPQVDICLHPHGLPLAMDIKSGQDQHHTFDEQVMQRDGRVIPKAEALVYHVRYYGQTSLAAPNALLSTNAYHDLWFPQVKQDLERRGYGLLLNLPTGDRVPPKSTDVTSLISSSAEQLKFEGADASADTDADAAGNEELLDAFQMSGHDVVNLPHFAADLSELVLTSIIERTAQSYDLYVDVFLLCHYVMRLQGNINQQVFLRVHPKTVDVWSYVMAYFARTKYNLPGKRSVDDRFECLLRTVRRGGDGAFEAVEEGARVPGRMVPSAASIDFNANYRFENVRCQLPNGRDAHMKYAGREDHQLQVELLKNDNVILKYRIPWLDRITGYMAFSPKPIGQWQAIDPVGAAEDAEGGGGEGGAEGGPDASVSSSSSTAVFSVEEGGPAHKISEVRMRVRDSMVYSLPSLSLDPWRGMNVSQAPARWTMDKVYLCVPGFRSSPSRKYMSHLLEFVQHHFMMGSSHIFLGVCFSWSSHNMRTLLRLLSPFIQQGRLSIYTHTDSLDYRFVVAGGVVRNTPVKVIAVNLCLFFAKGMADYVAIWDIDEFFIPRGGTRDLVHLIDSVDQVGDISYPSSVRPQRGMADGQGHPLCYLQLFSRSLYQVASMSPDASAEHIFFKENFMPRSEPIDRLSHKKAIHPTRRSFSLNLHMGGACALPLQWTDCAESAATLSSNVSQQLELRGEHCFAHMKGLRKGHQTTHDFDEPPQIEDTYSINSSTQAEIYHVQFFRRNMMVAAHVRGEENLYAQRHSAQVLRELDEKGYYLPLLLLNEDKFVDPHRFYSRHSLADQYQSVGNASSLLPSSSSLQRLPVFVLAAARSTREGADSVSVVVTWTGARTGGRHLIQAYASEHALPAIWAPRDSSALADLDTWSPTCRVSISNVRCRTSEASAGLASDSAAPLWELQCALAPRTDPDVAVSVALEWDTHVACAGGTPVLLNYSIGVQLPPRRAGTGLLNPPPHVDFVPTLYTSRGVGAALNRSWEVLTGGQGTHLCVSDPWRGAVTRVSLAPLLEFVQHHVLLGVERIYLPVALAWGSEEMQTLASVLQPFLSARQVVLWSTLTTSAAAGLDVRPAVVRMLVSLTCGFSAVKAGARYLGNWNTHQLYIPPASSAEDAALAPHHLDEAFASLPSGVQALKVAGAAVEDYAEAHLGVAEVRPVWLGDLYSRPMLPPASLGEGYGLRRLGKAPPLASAGALPSGDGGELGVLYDYFDIDRETLSCTKGERHLGDDVDVAHAQQELRVCEHHQREEAPEGEAHYDLGAAGITSISTAADSERADSNRYHTFHFPRVYRELIERSLDLFVDGIGLESVEDVPTFLAGDEAWPAYRTLFLSNPLVGTGPLPPLTKAIEILAEAKKKPKKVEVVSHRTFIKF